MGVAVEVGVVEGASAAVALPGTLVEAKLVAAARAVESGTAVRVLATASSPVLGKAMESGAGKIEPLVLPHAYSHLALMAGVA